MREGSRNSSANKNLKQAREAYETRTSQKEKRKIEELEGIVVEEEEKLEENDLEKEMEWVQDPGTTTTRVTQYVCTQAKMWRMKMMLAKAINMQGEYLIQARQAQQAISVILTDHAVVLEALDFKISSLEQQFGNISKKLTVLINLLQHSICQETETMGERVEEKIGTSQGKLSSQPQAGRASASTGQDFSTKYYIVLGL